MNANQFVNTCYRERIPVADMMAQLVPVFRPTLAAVRENAIARANDLPACEGNIEIHTRLLGIAAECDAMQPWSPYHVNLSADPSFFGQYTTPEYGVRYARMLADAIREAWPGIQVDCEWRGEHAQSVTGPDEEAVGRIERWIADNWLDVITTPPSGT